MSLQWNPEPSADSKVVETAGSLEDGSPGDSSGYSSLERNLQNKKTHQTAKENLGSLSNVLILDEDANADEQEPIVLQNDALLEASNNKEDNPGQNGTVEGKERVPVDDKLNEDRPGDEVFEEHVEPLSPVANSAGIVNVAKQAIAGHFDEDNETAPLVSNEYDTAISQSITEESRMDEEEQEKEDGSDADKSSSLQTKQESVNIAVSEKHTEAAGTNHVTTESLKSAKGDSRMPKPSPLSIHSMHSQSYDEDDDKASVDSRTSSMSSLAPMSPRSPGSPGPGGKDRRIVRKGFMDSPEWLKYSIYHNDKYNSQTRRLEGLKEGRSILVEGQMAITSYGFTISLQNGRDGVANTDILLLMHVSMTDENIILSHFLYGSWGAQEVLDKDRLHKELNTEQFPFENTKKFSIKFTRQVDYFVIYVDDKYITSFKHRTPNTNVTHARLAGDAHFTKLQCPYVLTLPHMQQVPCSLRPGHVVALDMYVLPASKSFSIQMSAMNKDVYASFVATTTFWGKTSVVEFRAVHNAKTCEPVTIDGHLPISRHQEMKLSFRVEKQKFQISLNDEHFSDFDHELPLDKLTHILVDGDVFLYSVRLLRPRGKYLIPVTTSCECCDCSIL